MDFKKLRKNKKMTIESVASALDVHPNTIMRLEKENDTDRISKRKFDALMELYGVDVIQNMKHLHASFGITHIPYFVDVVASMGGGFLNYEDSALEKMAIDTDMLRRLFGIHCTQKLSLINASGDSMVPTIPDGCILLVQETDIQDGCLCAFVLGEELYVKRIQKRPVLKFISDNKAYDDIYIKEEDNLRIIGKVLGVFKKV
ncbi:MAG: helix-turn-helix domain-containing protein [Clostridia bacterium]|nr:helix-turn-helix domain-containing protein [Clostridia bacterium]